MPLRIAFGHRSNHPITELAYKIRRNQIGFGSKVLDIECLENVEASIDDVFAWLDQKGYPPSEIEHLAPYFGTVWPSALALAEWASREGEANNLEGKSLLELGCGLALPSLIACQYGAAVTASDGHPDVVRFLEKNISLNGDVRVDFFVAEWATGGLPDLKFDFVIASDVLYESQHPALFSRVMTNHVKPGGKVVMADPGRSYVQAFVSEMKRLGWQENFTPWKVMHLGGEADIFLLSFEQTP